MTQEARAVKRQRIHAQKINGLALILLSVIVFLIASIDPYNKDITFIFFTMPTGFWLLFTKRLITY